ncbi:uncharacterized protein B0H64DRAFT_191757 [Chaetomium fimeti]|uniref:Uncharacterized protein n=1 Tax=Chaetomium fimeti TaxID=1854472 RepID=A0AAE0LRJ4_9PEZI|nr:hypothetical protein B0H64DRAFT_191757 [Chaetomium fimeti]
MKFSTPPPPHRPRILESITALGDSPMSIPDSQGTDDVEMQDTDWTESVGDGMLYDSPYHPSTETGHDTALRGGVIYPPPNLVWARKVAVASHKEQQREYVQYDNDEAEIDYEDLEDGYEDDGYSTSSDWDDYGTLPLTVGEYDEAVAGMEGSDGWNADQKKLHKLIYMRGLHPMMPSWWRVNFKMWGITQPHLDHVFTPKHSKKRVAIHAYGNEVAAGKALESLFYLSQTVTDYEEIGYQDKIAKTVVRGIRNYIKWAMRDVGIDMRKTQLNLLVQAYPPDFRADDDSEAVESDFAPSPVSSNEDQEVEMSGNDEHKDNVVEVFEATEAQRARQFTHAVSRDLERRLLNMGQRWRDRLRVKGGKGLIAAPPTLYAFAVIQHIAMLASHDPSSSTNPVVVLEQVHLNDRGKWLWNALSIALPVNMARDALNGMWETGVVVAEHGDQGTDPDL